MNRSASAALLGGRYTLLQPLEIGITAAVWRAEDHRLGREVAVKLLSSGLSADPVLRERFRREAAVAAGLSHPRIVAVYDYGESEVPTGGYLPFIVMELLRGETLSARLRRGPVPWREAALMAADVAEALWAAHQHGVVHRDVKPANVFRTEDGVKVLDFGIATTTWQPSLTGSGDLVGTPAYIAPERLAGKPAAPAADMYALGLVLFEAVTGHPPFPGEDWASLAQAHLTRTPPPLTGEPDLPDRLALLVRRCLDKQPSRRPDAAAAGRELCDLLGLRRRPGLAVSAVPAGPGPAAGSAGDGDWEPARDPAGYPAGDPAGGGRGYLDGEPGRSAGSTLRLWAPWAATPAKLTLAGLLVATLVVLGFVAADPAGDGAGQAARGRSSAVPSPSAEPELSGLPTDSGLPTETPPRTREPTPSPTPPRSPGGVGSLLQVVDAGAATGEIRDDVAVDLRNVINNLRGRAGAGGVSQGELDELRVKVEQRRGEGPNSISDARADELLAAIDGLGGIQQG